MLVRLLSIILINVFKGDAKTYADEFYGRIRGPNQAKGVDAGVVFVIIFGCVVGGFFGCCILGTLIFGFFDNGFRWPYQTRMRRTIPSMNTHL